MTTAIIISDPKLLAAIRRSAGETAVCTSAGDAVGVAHVAPAVSSPSDRLLPMSEAELAARSRPRTGRALADILRDLESRG